MAVALRTPRCREYAPMWAGESCGVVNDVKPAGVIVLDLVREAEVALA